MLCLTDLIFITSLIISISKGSFLSRTTVITTLLPTGPRSCDTASFIESPLIDSPFIPIIKSPDFIPALAAGVSSMGETTFTTPSSIVISMPKPPNFPLVFTCMSLYDSGLK